MTDLTSYMLGRAAERSDRNSAELCEQIADKFRGRVPVDVDALQREIASLHQTIASKTQYIAELKQYTAAQRRDYDRLKKWADEAENTIEWYKSREDLDF